MYDSIDHSIRAVALAMCALALAGSALDAQQVPPAPSPPAPAIAAQVAPYRPPVIALVQPIDGGTVYQDKPVIVLRFAAGEATDPIDASSFSVTVDGHDRTSLFQTSATDAWGPLAAPAAGDSTLAPGPHRVAARICSARGACALVQATVSIIPLSATGTAAPAATTRSLRQRLLEAALSATRRLLVP